MALKTIKFPSEQTQRKVLGRGLNVFQLLDWPPLELDFCRAGEAAEDGTWGVLRELYMAHFIHTGPEDILSKSVNEHH